MKFALILLLAVFSQAVFSRAALADSLFNDDVCPIVDSPSSPQPSAAMFYAARVSPLGLTCQQIQGIGEANEYAKLILTSAVTAAARSPSLAADLAAAGLTYANPAVLTVAVVGGFGIVTFEIVLKASLAECERQSQEDLRNSIMEELQTKYGLRANQSDIPLEIAH